MSKLSVDKGASAEKKEANIVKKLCCFSALLLMMILNTTGNAGAYFACVGESFYGGVTQRSIKENGPFIKASPNLGEREAVPRGLTKTAWGKIRASVERDRYRLHRDERTGGYQAPNYAHGLHFAFTRQGFEVSPRKGEEAWTWALIRRHTRG